MQVKDVMTTRPHYLGESASIREVAEAMRDNSSGFEPLMDDNKVIAVVTDRDLVVNGIADNADVNAPATSVASERVLYIYQEDSVEEALANMAEQQVQRLLVLDSEERLLVLDSEEDKQLVGILTVSDIAQKCEDMELTEQLAAAVSRYH